MKEESASSLQAKECSEKATARRRLDPRVSLVALVLLNVIAFTASSLWVLVAAIAMDTVLLIWCGKPKLAFYWLLGYAALNAIWYGCVAAGPAFNPFGACFLYMSKIIPAAMFASAMISTTHTGELASSLSAFQAASRSPPAWRCDSFRPSGGRLTRCGRPWRCATSDSPLHGRLGIPARSLSASLFPLSTGFRSLPMSSGMP